MDLEFGELDLENTARPRADLPPLELKPAESGAKANVPPRAPGASEPVPAARLATPFRVEPLSIPSPPSRKFEFTDITQDLGQAGAPAEPLELDEDLRGIGGGSLDLGKMESEGASTRGMDRSRGRGGRADRTSGP